MQPGIQPNGLFWTTQIPQKAFWSGQRFAGLGLSDRPLVETFEFGGANTVPATASMDLKWRRTSAEQARGEGTAVDPDHPSAFEGSFADAICTGSVSAERLGFSFESSNLTSTGYYASIGTERNGAWLS